MRAPNLIHGLTLDVAYDGDGETGESLADWLRAVLLPVVDSVLAAQDRQGQVCRIERLEIDLGTVSRDHAEDELARLLQAQLADALRWQLAHAPVQADEVAPAADGGHDAGAQLMQFLRSGRLPWAIAADPQTAHEQLLRQVLAMPSAARVLQSVVQDQQMLTRLVRQYNAAMLHEVTAALYPHRPVQQAPGDAPEAFWLKVLQPEAPGTALQPPDPALSQFRDWKQRKRDLPEQGLSLAELQQWLIWWLMHDSTLVNQDCSLMLASIKQQCAQAREPERFMRLVLAALRDGVPLDLDALASQASQPPSQLQPAAPMDAITSLRSQQAIRNFIAQQALEHEELGNLNSAQLHQLVRGWIGGTSSVFLSAIESHALQAAEAHAYFRRILTKLLDGQPIDLEALAAPVDAPQPVAPPAATHANAVAAGAQPATATRANTVSAAATTIAASPAESASMLTMATATASHGGASADATSAATGPVGGVPVPAAAEAGTLAGNRSVVATPVAKGPAEGASAAAAAPAAMSARDPVAVAALAGTGPAEGASAAATEAAAPPAENASSPARSVATTPVEAASAAVAPAGSPFALAASTAASPAESASSPAISTATAPHGGVSAAVTAAATGPVGGALAASPAETGTQAENPSLVATPIVKGPAEGAAAAAAAPAAMSARDPVAVAVLAGAGPADGASAAAIKAAAPLTESASSPARSVATTPVEAASAAVAPVVSQFALAASTVASPAESASSPAISTAAAPSGDVSAAATTAVAESVGAVLAAAAAEAGTLAENPSLVATPIAKGPAEGASATAAAPAAMSAEDLAAVAALAGKGPAEGASAVAIKAATPSAESASSPARSVATAPVEAASTAASPAESASSPSISTATAPHGGISAVASSDPVTPADGASLLSAPAAAMPAAPALAEIRTATLAPPAVVPAVAEIARPSQPDHPMQQRSRPAGAPSPLPALLLQSLPQRLASALLQADLRPLEIYWSEITRHHADILAAAARRYLRRPQERAQLISHSPPDMLVEMIIAIAPKTGAVVKTVLRQAEACNDVLPQPLTADEFQQSVLNFAFHQALDGGQGGTILDLIAATQGAVDMVEPVAYAWRVVLPPMPELEQVLFGARYLQILRAEGDDMAPSLQALLADEVCTRYPELLDPQQLERLAVTGPAGRLNGADVEMPEGGGATGAVAARSASRRPAAEPEAMLAILLMRAEPLGHVDHITAELLLQRLLRAADVALSGALETALSQPAAIERLAGLAPAPVLAQLLVRLQPALAAQLPAILRAVAAKTSVNQVPAMQPRSTWRAVYHAAFVAADPVTPAEFIRTLMRELGGGALTPPPPAPAAAAQDIMKRLLQPITAKPAERPETIQAVDEDSAGESNIRNAGMVIIATYAQRLFSILELTKDGQFISEEAAQRAVHLLQYAITGASATPEYQLTLNKLLCGIHGGKPIARGIDITDKEKDTIEQMLNGVIAHWKALGKTSIAGLRQTFLQREGQLHFEDDAWRLHIPSATFDMLLDRLPWSFAMIKFPWMEHPLQVTWR